MGGSITPTPLSPSATVRTGDPSSDTSTTTQALLALEKARKLAAASAQQQGGTLG